MAASYVATADVDALIGSERRQALWSNESEVYQSAEYERAVELASEKVRIACKAAGYTLGDSTTDDSVKLATVGQLLLMGYGRKGERVPDQFAAEVSLMEAIRLGHVHLSSTAADGFDGVGGSKFSESRTSITTSAPRIFSRKEQDYY